MRLRQRRGTVIAGPAGIVYTPPTGEDRIRGMLDELWSFMNEGGTHPLVRMAAGHHQFESIHPFTDGNGRTGRLINLLYLSEQKLTDLPIVSLSRYMLRNRTAYYRLLGSTRRTRDWEPWVLWMLDGVRQTAEWITDTLERQATITERAISRYRHAKPRGNVTDEAIRLVCNRLYSRSRHLLDAGVSTKATAALATLRQLASTGIVEEQPNHPAALFINRDLLALWTTP